MRTRTLMPLVLPTILLVVLPSCGIGDPGPTLDLPPRPDGAPGGARIADEVRGLDPVDWDRRVTAEVLRGNVPGWLRRLEPVHLRGPSEGQGRTLTFWVTPDYLAVGSDDDFLLVPLSPGTAHRIAERAGASLPTPGIVDAVWAAARTRLTPVRFDPEEGIRTVPYFLRHDRIIRGQRRQYGIRPGTFLAGHKLDVVRVSQGPAEDGGVGLYGWHLPSGEPIQPLFPVELDRPPHFSLGVRLVSRKVWVDGEPRDLLEILEEGPWAGLLATSNAPGGAALPPPGG